MAAACGSSGCGFLAGASWSQGRQLRAPRAVSSSSSSLALDSTPNQPPLQDASAGHFSLGKAASQLTLTAALVPALVLFARAARRRLAGPRRPRALLRAQRREVVATLSKGARAKASPASAAADAGVVAGSLHHGVVENPATCWPAGKPRLTLRYQEEYDLSDPVGSFKKVGKMLMQELRDELPDHYELPAREVSWVEKSLAYNTQGGKMNRGLFVVHTGVELMRHRGETPTNRDLHRLAVLGWCLELLQACFLMADDMMDGSETRRGNPCWYKRPEVGLLNTIDFLMMEMFAYKGLKRHFGTDECYPWLLDLFQETTFQTECGQLMDAMCANCELDELTPERWQRVVKYKTAFYSFYLPVATAMLASGIRDRESFDVAREALVEMGVFFQAQDDYLDAFANPDELGKIGTDIQDKKCSWLFAHCYHVAGTPEARALLDDKYGKCKAGSEDEQAIKELYRKQGLLELFQEYEAETVRNIDRYKQRVEEVNLPWSIFDRFFAKISHRRK